MTDQAFSETVTIESNLPHSEVFALLAMSLIQRLKPLKYDAESVDLMKQVVSCCKDVAIHEMTLEFEKRKSKEHAK